jgi:hypothetical protein
LPATFARMRPPYLAARSCVNGRRVLFIATHAPFPLFSSCRLAYDCGRDSTFARRTSVSLLPTKSAAAGYGPIRLLAETLFVVSKGLVNSEVGGSTDFPSASMR